jgi:hypothetical protein
MRKKANLDLLEKPLVSETSFMGDTLTELAGWIHILKEYSDVCMPVTGLIWTCTFDEAGKCTRELIVPERFIDRFLECQTNPNVRFMFGNIELRYPNSTADLTGPHSNAILYDKSDNSVEIFEPVGKKPAHGTTWYDEDIFHEDISKFFRQQLDVKNVYTGFCPAASFQMIQSLEDVFLETDPMGFCNAWTLWWLDFRLANADIDMSREELAEEAIDMLKTKPKYFTTFIRNYAEFIIQERTKIIMEAYDRLNESEEGQKLLSEQASFRKAFNKLRREIFTAKKAGELEIAAALTDQQNKLRFEHGPILQDRFFQELERIANEFIHKQGLQYYSRTKPTTK